MLRMNADTGYEVLLEIAAKMNRNILLSGDAVRSALFCLALVPSAYAGGDDFLQCAQKFPGDAAGRLKCYDQLAAPISAPQESIVPDEEAEASAAPAADSTRSAERSYLTRVWNLDDLSSRDPSKLGRLQPYRQSYLVVKKTGNPNRQPGSPLPDHNALAPNDIDAAEAKFQLSFKADIGNQRNIEFMGIRTLRFWGAYTQQSNWQVFNIRNSSPFRETIYEPELIATLGTGNASGLKLINLGWLHQSNGRPLPESRSWNRIYLLGGWEWNDMTSIMGRVWRRIPEHPLKDDNPDIVDYVGRADLVIRWEPRDKSQAVAMLLRNNLSRKASRGYVQIDWATPVRFGSAARMHIQITSGFGESLIDYNHHQNTFGLGFSFREW
jgi:phospholipase A1